MKVQVPVKGEIIDITKVKDEMFAQKMIGDGMAIIPTDEKICSPIDGTLVAMFPTNHAFIVSDGTNNIMVHIGLDTVDLNGKPFVRLIEQGKQVKAGRAVIISDYKLIKRKGYDPTVIVVAIDGSVVKEKSNERVCNDTTETLFELG